MISTELVVATLFSSVVGSLHCVGMCTPFAVLAMGPADASRSIRATRLLSYHLGRLITYLTLGACVAVASSLARRLTGGDGSLPIVAWAVGLTMIGLGVARLIATFGYRMPVQHSEWSQQWASAIVKLRRVYARGPVWLSSVLWGLTSTLLPCGWLYLFVLAAAAAPNWTSSVFMMLAFWIGTLPLLSGVAWGWSSLEPKWQSFAQPFAAACIISFGMFILMQRGSIELRPPKEVDSHLQLVANANVESAEWTQPMTALEMVRRALSTTLPCCRGNDVATP